MAFPVSHPNFVSPRLLLPPLPPHSIGFPFPPPPFAWRPPLQLPVAFSDVALRPAYTFAHHNPPVGYSVAALSASPSGSGESDDSKWVRKWLEGKGKEFQSRAYADGRDASTKLADAKELVGQAFELLGLLRQLNDEMANDINMADDEWKESVARAVSVQESLVSVQAQINDPVVQASLETQIDKKRNRRAYLKRRRKRKWEEKRQQSAKSQQLHQEIDEWRAKLIAADIASKRESELRLEAGETLTEVKAKQREADKMKQLLESLKELRAHRLESAQKRGEKFTEETKVFEERVKKLESLILRQQETYQSEEKTLKTLMEEEGEVVEQEQLKLVREVAKQEETSVSHGEDPMKEFVEYYSQADRYLDSFIGIRHWWDSFVVPSEIPGGSRIPDGSIEAVEPSTKAWEQYLSTDKDKLNCAVEERQQ